MDNLQSSTTCNELSRSIHSSIHNTDTDDEKQLTQSITSDIELQLTPQQLMSHFDDDDEKQSEKTPLSNRVNSLSSTSHDRGRRLSIPSWNKCYLQLDDCCNWPLTGTTLGALAISVVPSTAGVFLAPTDKTLNITLDACAIVCSVASMCILMRLASTKHARHCAYWGSIFGLLIAVPVGNIVNVLLVDDVQTEKALALAIVTAALALATIKSCTKLWHCQREPDTIKTTYKSLDLEDVGTNLNLKLKLRQEDTKQRQEDTKQRQEDTKQIKSLEGLLRDGFISADIFNQQLSKY